MPRYLATLKGGDQILTTAEDESGARVRIRNLYHVREPGFAVVPDPLVLARQELLEMIEQAASLLARYREAFEPTRLAALEEDKHQLLLRLQPDEVC